MSADGTDHEVTAKHVEWTNELQAVVIKLLARVDALEEDVADLREHADMLARRRRP